MTRPLNILHVSTAHTWRGGEQQIAYLYEELQRLGQQQTILCAESSALAEKAQAEGWNYVTAPKKGSISIPYARKLAQLSSGFDIIHIHDSHAHNNAVLSTFFGNKTPMVLHRRVDFPVSNNIFSRYKYNHPQIKKIICVSDAIKAIMLPAISEKSKLVTIHSGVDTDRVFKADGRLHWEYNLPDNIRLIGNVAALAPHKDYFTFLNAAHAIWQHRPDNDFRFVIIGEGGMRPQIEHEIQKLGLQDMVIMTGFRKDLSEVIPELDIFLITSETEGLGTSIIDAFLAGVPVVATAAGGISEIVEHEKTGLLAPVKDAGELAEQVEKLLDNATLAQQLTANARQKAATFSKQRMAEQILRQYRQIVP